MKLIENWPYGGPRDEILYIFMCELPRDRAPL